MKRGILILLLAICVLFTVSIVCAGDVNDVSIASDDANLTELSLNNEITNLQTGEGNAILAQNDDETVSAQTGSQILDAGEGTYADLRTDINNGGSLTKSYYRYRDGDGDTITISTAGFTVDGHGAVIDMAGSTIRAFYVDASGVTFKDLTIKNANFDGSGAAISFSRAGTLINCNFNNNHASTAGGALYFSKYCDVINCNFADNSAYHGGAVFSLDDGTEVTNCTFTENSASHGGSIVFMYDGTVENCNFFNNIASYDGGAIKMDSGNVENCNFFNNIASYDGGAVRIGSGRVENCNFTKNAASSDGGAVYFNSNGEVTNCNFTANTASSDGGAVYFNSNGVVTDCNFTGNAAVAGSAIYYYSSSGTKTVSNSILLNNRAKVDDANPFNLAINENNIKIIFKGQNNLLNAIYSNGDVGFTNVIYWGANGISNTGASAVKPSRSNNEAGQNITVAIVVNDEIVLNEVKVTDDNGAIVLDMSVGENYYIRVCHDEDSYYTGAEKVSEKMTFYVNVSEMKTTDRTVNITAKSNIYKGIVPGEMRFVLPDGREISANYCADGIWWAVHRFASYADYQVSASYSGVDADVTDAIISIFKSNSTVNVSDVVIDYGDWKNVTVTAEGATGVTAKINNTEVTVINRYTIPISDLAVGNYTLTVTTIADEDHESATKTASITVNKVNSTLTVNDIVFDYGSSGSGDVSFTGATGITAKIIGHDEAIVYIGENAVTVSNLTVGNYTLEVTTMPDSNHTGVTRTVNVTVNRIDSTLIVNNVTLDYGSSSNVTVTAEGAIGITAKINNTEVTVINRYTIPISDLAVGNYTLTVTTIADEDHESATKTASITVNKVNSTLTVNDIVFDYGSSGSGDVSFTGATGITAKIIGHDEAIVNITGNTITVSNLTVGNYTLEVTTIPDSNHTGVTRTVNVTVKRIDSTLAVDNVTLDYGSSSNVTVTAEGAIGITAKINNTEVTVINRYTIPISDLAVGNYTLTVTTIADEDHESATKTASITVNKVNSTLTVNDIVFDYGSSGSGDVSFTGATGVTAKIMGHDEAIVYIGENAITVSNLTVENYTLEVTTIPDSNHTGVTRTVNVTVNRIDSTLAVDNVTLDYGSSSNVTVTAEGATGITAEIDGNPVETMGNMIPISDLAAGIYNLTVTTIPDANHNSVNRTVKVTVNKVDSTLIVNDVVMDYGSSVNMTATVQGAVGITAEIDGKEIAVSGNVIMISGLSAGTHYLTVTAIPDANHTSVNRTANITVNKIDSIITAADKAYVINYGGTYEITLKDAKGIVLSGQTVTFTLNGKNIGSAVTNAKGVASIKLTAAILKTAKAGTKNLVVKFTGDAKYSVASKTVKITINKEKTKIKAKKKTFKRTKKVKKYTITLKNSKNKPVKKVKVTLKIKGKKTIKAKTNAKGKATFKIKKLTKKGTYKATVIYKGNKYYNKVTKKVKIKVK